MLVCSHRLCGTWCRVVRGRPLQATRVRAVPRSVAACWLSRSHGGFLLNDPTVVLHIKYYLKCAEYIDLALAR